MRLNLAARLAVALARALNQGPGSRAQPFWEEALLSTLQMAASKGG